MGRWPLQKEPLECRQCGAICEQVVYPWRCLRTEQGCVYAFEDDDSTYFGCLHKIFSPELDMAAFFGGEGSTALADPYGSLRIVRAPRPQCPVSVERACAAVEGREPCSNPAFAYREAAEAPLAREERGASGRGGRGGRCWPAS
jgi:hypothetical protein